MSWVNQATSKLTFLWVWHRRIVTLVEYCRWTVTSRCLEGVCHLQDRSTWTSKGWFSLEHKHKHKHKHKNKHKWKQPWHKHKHKRKHKKNEPTYLSCAVFTSDALDISINISTRKTDSSVFLVLMFINFIDFMYYRFISTNAKKCVWNSVRWVRNWKPEFKWEDAAIRRDVYGWTVRSCFHPGSKY